MNAPISIIVPLKNRTKFDVVHDKHVLTLRLFENNVKSLASLYKPEVDAWELVVADYNSDDVPDLQQYLQDLAGAIPVRVLQQKGNFNRGFARNRGAEAASYDVLFFLDADMEIRTRELFEDIQKHVVGNNVALFPICYSYRNPQHTIGYRRTTGVGNCICTRVAFVESGGYAEYRFWGKEDNWLYDNMKRKLRTYYGVKFVHQWHPNSRAFKNRYATRK